MKYWVAYDDRNQKDEIVAFHEERKVVQEYIDSVIDVTYKLGRCKSSELKKIEDVDELYLVKHLDTYVQCKYYEFMDNIVEEQISDLRQSVHTLERVLRLDNPGKKRKPIVKTIAYLKELILEAEGTIPDYEAVRREYNEFMLQKERMIWGDTIDFEDTNKYIDE